MDPSSSAILEPQFGSPVLSLQLVAILVLGLVTLGVVAINRQLTVRRLRESERAFRGLYDNMGEGVFPASRPDDEHAHPAAP